MRWLFLFCLTIGLAWYWAKLDKFRASVVDHATVAFPVVPRSTLDPVGDASCTHLVPSDPTVIQGDRLVVWLEWWHPGNFSLHDDSFDRLVLELPRSALDHEIDLGAPDVRTYFATGSVPYDPPCLDKTAATVRGKVLVGTNWYGRMRVRVDAHAKSEARVRNGGSLSAAMPPRRLRGTARAELFDPNIVDISRK